MDKKAELGISTLILAIAMILVAAIVFVVFTQSTFQVSQEARTVGMVTKSNVGTAIQIVKLYGQDGSSGTVNYLFEEIKLPYGSDEIKLNESLFLLSLNSTGQTYSYNSGINCSDTNNTSATSIYNSANAAYFGVVYVRGSATYTDILAPGELIRICVKTPAGISKDDRIKTDFFSKSGFHGRVDVTYTKRMADTNIFFFP